MKKLIAALLVLISVFAYSVNASAAQINTYYSYTDIRDVYTYTYAGNEILEMPYHVYVPQNYNKNTKYPVAVVLHGAGERGNDNIAHLGNFFILNMATRYSEQFQAIIILPQCPAEGWWSDIYTDCVIKIVDDVKSRYSTDDDRLYITGYSMGGGGTWDIGIRYADKVAALAPVCGTSGGDIYQDAQILKNMPIWIFHGQSDTVVSAITSENWNQALKAAGNSYVKLTLYKMMDHNIWSNVWSDLNFYKWMFKQVRGKPEVGALWDADSTTSSSTATQSKTGIKETSSTVSGSGTVNHEGLSTAPASNKESGINRNLIIILGSVTGIIIAVLLILYWIKTNKNKHTRKDGDM